MDTVDSTVASPSGKLRHSHSNKQNEGDHSQLSIHSISTPNSNAANPMINGWCRLWVSLWWDEEWVMMHRNNRIQLPINQQIYVHCTEHTHAHKVTESCHWCPQRWLSFPTFLFQVGPKHGEVLLSGDRGRTAQIIWKDLDHEVMVVSCCVYNLDLGISCLSIIQIGNGLICSLRLDLSLVCVHRFHKKLIS